MQWSHCRVRSPSDDAGPGRVRAAATALNENVRRKELKMIYYMCWLLVVGVMATVLGLDGVGAVAVELAAVLFVAEMGFELMDHLFPKRAGQA